MERMINSAEELVDHLRAMHKQKDESFGDDFVFVDAKVRRDFLISDRQGKIILSANVHDVDFYPIGGGVYKVKINYRGF